MGSIETYHDRLITVFKQNQSVVEIGVQELAAAILEMRDLDKHVWIIGNGGSASTAEHFETDLSFVKLEAVAMLPNVAAITANSALVTAVSNDVSYSKLFETILVRKVRSGDLLICISASGNSYNIINAISIAKSRGVRTFSLLGFDGGEASFESDQSIIVNTNQGEYGIVEDIHLSICHAVSTLIREKLMN